MKIGVCGHVSRDGTINGQSIKTQILIDELKRVGNSVGICDTATYKESPIRFFRNFFRIIKMNDHVILLPARKAVNVLIPLGVLLGRIYKRGIHYYVVGGWIQKTIEKNWYLRKPLKRLSTIIVEIETMERDLASSGFTNVVRINKFREIKILNECELDLSITEPMRLCVFSRVMKEKGIEEAISAVNDVNNELGKRAFILDIYGPIDNEYNKRFIELVEQNNETVQYKGVIDYKLSTDALKGYFALLFPTYYEGEGYPNTIVDAYAAGLPVIATNWKYNSEIVRNGRDGIIYEGIDTDALKKVLHDVARDPKSITAMKPHALMRAKDYAPDKAIQIIIERFNEIDKREYTH